MTDPVPRAPARLRVRVPLLLGLATAVPGCGAPAPNPSAPVATVDVPTTPPTARIAEAPEPTAAGPSPIRFRSVPATESGLDFVHTSGNSPEKFFPTANGSGVALIDYDGDGLIDIYFATTRNLPLSDPSRSGGNRLYRNLGGARFEDVTERAGVGHDGFTHAVASGDVNGDGLPDLVLTCLGPNVLYLNRGDGTFRDASEGSGLTDIPWSSGAAFLDYDNDGRLDLYVSCYGVWDDAAREMTCGDAERGVRTYCSPINITPTRHYLFRNRGDATFEDTTRAAGILRHDGRGMGIVAADLNRDGWTDLYVANDLCPNFLFLNQGDGTFEDVSELSGAASSESGANQAGMGVDAEDLDGDGLPELFVTNFSTEYNTLYRNIDGRNFQDISAGAGIVKDSLPDVGWGCGLVDFDNDGGPDMMVVNGEVDDNLAQLNGGPPQAERAKVWRHRGGLSYQFLPDPGPYFRTPHVARGVAFGDLDNDGDADAVVVHMDETPALLLNESDGGGWIGLDLVGVASNHDAIGARVEVHVGGTVLHRQVRGGRSYHSAGDRRVLVGLGSAGEVDRVEIHWPRGQRSSLASPEFGRYHRVVEPPTESAGAIAAGGGR